MRTVPVSVTVPWASLTPSIVRILSTTAGVNGYGFVASPCTASSVFLDTSTSETDPETMELKVDRSMSPKTNDPETKATPRTMAKVDMNSRSLRLHREVKVAFHMVVQGLSTRRAAGTCSPPVVFARCGDGPSSGPESIDGLRRGSRRLIVVSTASWVG